MTCGACEGELPDAAYSEGPPRCRQSIMKKGRKRSEEDDCPICNRPLPLDDRQSSFKACCMKRVCNGCTLAARKRGMFDCAFCRTPIPDEDDIIAMIQKRVDAGDPKAICRLGSSYFYGLLGLEKDVTRAVELYERAAELGVKGAHYNLGVLYNEGTDVRRDTVKAIRHYEAAAMLGHVSARFNLGNEEARAGSFCLALQHYLIAAKMGHECALNPIRRMLMGGDATKADYSEAMRGYQSAIEEMRSPDRDEALALGIENIFLMWSGANDGLVGEKEPRRGGGAVARPVKVMTQSEMGPRNEEAAGDGKDGGAPA